MNTPSPLAEVTHLFLRFGLTGFGGPAAHIALFHDEVVQRRQWLTDQEFLDLLGATNLIPGPNSTEMAIHLGLVRAGWRGLIAAGVCFILPSVLMVLGLAILYVEYQTTPTVDWLLFGIKPVVLAIIAQALWLLGRKALKSRTLIALGGAALGLYLLGVNELVVLFGLGLGYMVLVNAAGLAPLLLLISGNAAIASTEANGERPVSLIHLFLIFLKVGSLLYGGGYVLLAFLQNDLVNRLGWVTEAQLLDAVAIGQLTPGPLFTTATFIGYVVAGVPGAALATLGIFLPSFAMVAAVHPLLPRMRQSVWLGALLDGVNAAALGLMAGVTVILGRAAVVNVYSLGVALIAGVVLLRYKPNSTWLIVGGALAGWVYHVLG